MPVTNPSTASAQGPTQSSTNTFADFIVVNGVSIRPLITLSGSDVVVSWEFEHNGVWKEQSARTNP